MNQLVKAFLFFDFKQKSRPTRTDFFHITSVFISTTGNNCRQGVVNTQNGPLRTLRKNTSKKTKTA